MKVLVDIVGEDTLLKAFRRAPLEVAKELRLGMEKACTVVQRYAATHLGTKTPARSIGKAVQIDVAGSGLEGNVFLDTGIVKHAVYVHEGTKPHVIRAKTKAALFWRKKGKSFFVPKKPYIGPGKKNPYWAAIAAEGKASVSFKGHVDHPGTSPNQFLYRAASAKENDVELLIDTAINKALAKVGL